MKGSYSILVKLSEPEKLSVGSLGEIKFEEGFYVYNGSAFGPGGLKRADRHKDKSKKGSNAHWHIDYLLILEQSEIERIFKKEDSDHECSLSEEMRNRFQNVNSFGCSDCHCKSHLFFSKQKEHIENFLIEFYS